MRSGIPSTVRATSFKARGRCIDFSAGPLLMGILNATPDSFSDAGLYRTTAARIRRGLELIADGADIIDIGGESAVTNRPAVTAEHEIARVVPVIEGLSSSRRDHGVCRHIQASCR